LSKPGAKERKNIENGYCFNRQKQSSNLPLMKVLITAGPTVEPIDPVRFISNRSSGKMGIALAEEFASRGFEVTLVKGPTPLNPQNPNIRQILIETAQEMYETCAQYFPFNDVIVFAAAVADYTPLYPSSTKIKKKEEQFSIEMVRTKDIALELGKLKKPNQVSVGFALETDNEMSNALEKLKKKNFDFIVLNSVNDKGAGFQADTNKITIIDNAGKVTKFDLKPKTEVAKDIADEVGKIIERNR
jgi:phosphopantothenoylcysteine decarboxylase/phosphopantothenate--cysteine ligase